MVADVSRRGHHDAEADDACHSVERPEVLARDCQDVERCDASRLPCRVSIELRADPADECRCPTFSRKHPSKKEEVAGLDGFRVGTERFGRRWKSDTKLLQPILR